MYYCTLFYILHFFNLRRQNNKYYYRFSTCVFIDFKINFKSKILYTEEKYTNIHFKSVELSGLVSIATIIIITAGALMISMKSVFLPHKKETTY